MGKLELDLLENAVDSLNEALEKYQQGKRGDLKSFKFCIKHLSHFFELILKYYVTQSHPLLIYKNPFAKNINRGSQTIGLHEAINFLKNEGLNISEIFEGDLKWLKELRNDIEHHKFSMVLDEVEQTIGRLMTAMVVFSNSHKKLDIGGYIDDDQYEIFHKLANTYQDKLKKALSLVEEARRTAYKGYRPKEYSLVDFSVYLCHECNHETMIPDETSSSGYRCTYCGNEESGDVEVECGICGMQWPNDLMWYTDWADTGENIYVCPRCRRDPEYVKDDD